MCSACTCKWVTCETPASWLSQNSLSFYCFSKGRLAAERRDKPWRRCLRGTRHPPTHPSWGCVRSNYAQERRKNARCRGAAHYLDNYTYIAAGLVCTLVFVLSRRRRTSLFLILFDEKAEIKSETRDARGLIFIWLFISLFYGRPGIKKRFAAAAPEVEIVSLLIGLDGGSATWVECVWAVQVKNNYFYGCSFIARNATMEDLERIIGFYVFSSVNWCPRSSKCLKHFINCPSNWGPSIFFYISSMWL